MRIRSDGSGGRRKSDKILGIPVAFDLAAQLPCTDGVPYPMDENHRMSAKEDALNLVLEFARADQPGDPFAFRFAPQEYLLRRAGGVFESVRLEWDTEFLRDLTAVRLPGRDPAVLQRLGETLRRWLNPAGWPEYERQILDAAKQGRRVVLTILSAAAELYSLPWELVTLGSSGQHLGELPEVLIRYKWPQDSLSAEPSSPPAPEGGRILFAWSAAMGAVPASEHLGALKKSATDGSYAFDPAADVIESASCQRLVAALTEAGKTNKPVTILHLLCHGAAAGSTFGLALDSEDSAVGAAVVDAGRLRQLLAPFSQTLRLIILAACDSGNSGELGNQLGSVAQTLHRAGIPAVVASRYPLSVSGSIRIVEELYKQLLIESAGLETGILAARASLALDATQLDWASLQLYASDQEGVDSRPVVFRPFRGLLAFQPEHHRYYFGRDAEIAEVCGKLAALSTQGQPRFLMVAGASGSGKSSLVLAGVVPRLLSGSGGPSPKLVRLRPGPEAIQFLDTRLEKKEEGPPALIVVDQFEEVFTQIEKPATRQELVRKLWRLAGDKDSTDMVIATIRIDYVGRCGELVVDESGRRLDAVAYSDPHRILVAQMGREACALVIIQPLKRVGLALEEGLAARLLDEVEGEPGGLPLLQDTLDLLWQRRRGALLTQAAFDELGGVSGSLQRRADRLLAELLPDELTQARRMLVRLVDISEDVAMSTRRPVLLSALVPQDQDQKQASSFRCVLAKLGAARLVVCDGEGTKETAELAHEALIRKWPRLKEWVQSDRLLLADIARVEGWLEQWQKFKLLTIEQLTDGEKVAQRAGDQLSEAARAMLAARAIQERRFQFAIRLVGALLAVPVVMAFSFPAERELGLPVNPFAIIYPIVLYFIFRKPRAAQPAQPTSVRDAPQKGGRRDSA